MISFIFTSRTPGCCQAFSVQPLTRCTVINDAILSNTNTVAAQRFCFYKCMAALPTFPDAQARRKCREGSCVLTPYSEEPECLRSAFHYPVNRESH